MKKNYTLGFAMIALLLTSQLFSQVDVTFRLDMSGESVSTDGVHVAGSLNGWNTTSDMLTQEGSTDIYSVVLSLDTGWYEYKFLNGNAWGTDESPGAPCAPSNGNRYVYINDSGNPVTLEPVPFGGCNGESTGFTVTFNVDMSSEGSISAEGVHLAGVFNGWSPDNLLVSDVSGDIHSQTMRLPTPADYPIVLQYKYLNGNSWGTEETPESGCATVSGTDRLVTVTNSGDNLYDVFNGCTFLSVEENTLSEISVIYNSNSRNLTINRTNADPVISKVQVFDITGKLINFSENFENSNRIVVDVSSLNNGIYFVNIGNENSQTVQKILVY
jgi:hypothetical protein